MGGLSNQKQTFFERRAGEQTQQPPSPNNEPCNVGTEQSFMFAVYRALKDLNRPDLLRTNPLINSRLLAAAPPASTPSAALRDLIRIHCERLGQSQKYKRYRQVLEQTYLTPLRKQRAVADELHLSWSTYRRCLGDASRMLAASLWEAERGLQFASQAPGTARAWPWAVLAAMIVLTMLAGSGYLYAHRRRDEEKPADTTSPAAVTMPAGNYTQDISGTQDLFFVGMEYLDERSDLDVSQAIHYFRESVRTDPGNANTWAALAMAYAVWHAYSDSQIPDAHYSEALANANKAVTLDPTQPLAHAVLALLHQEHWEWQEAEREYQLALRLDPGNANTQRWYAKYFWLTGDTRRALQHMRAAETSDPLSDVTRANFGRALTYVGALRQAENQLLASTRTSPRFRLNYDYLTETHLAMKLYAQVLEDVQTAESVTERSPDDFLLMESGVAEAGLGRKDLARKVLLTLQQQAPEHYVSGVLTARLYWALGDKDRCFAELERAVREHDDNFVMLAGPDWTTVRTDTRFAAIRKQMGLSSTGHPIH